VARPDRRARRLAESVCNGKIPANKEIGLPTLRERGKQVINPSAA